MRPLPPRDFRKEPDNTMSSTRNFEIWTHVHRDLVEHLYMCIHVYICIDIPGKAAIEAPSSPLQTQCSVGFKA